MSEATAEAVNGANESSSERLAASTPPPPLSDARAARRAAGRAAYLEAAVADSVKSANQEPPPAAKVPPTEEAAAAVDPPDETPPPDDADAAAVDPPEPEPAAAKADPDLQKRLDVVQKAEKRAREAVAAERATFAKEREAFEVERKEWKERLDRFDSLAKRAKYDLASVALELGLTEDDFEPQARDLYAKSKKGAADPKNRAAAAQSAREREQADRIAQLEAKFEARDKADAEREQQASVQRGVSAFVEGAVKAVGDDAPLVKALLAKNPAKARQTIGQAALYLLDQTGETPEFGDVIAEIEKFRRAELEELGIDPSVVATPKTKTLPADETKTAPTLSSDLGTPTKPPRTKRQSKEERRREILAGLERGGRAE